MHPARAHLASLSTCNRNTQTSQISEVAEFRWRKYHLTMAEAAVDCLRDMGFGAQLLLNDAASRQALLAVLEEDK